MYYQPVTRAIFTTHSEIRIALNTSFPEVITDAQLEAFGIFPVVAVMPSYDPITQNALPLFPEQDPDTGAWVQQWRIVEATPTEIEIRQHQARLDNKQKAIQELQNSDWSELASVIDPAITPHLANGAAFVAYRAKLRAIVLNPPISVKPEDWPAPPLEQWVE